MSEAGLSKTNKPLKPAAWKPGAAAPAKGPRQNGTRGRPEGMGSRGTKLQVRICQSC